MLRYAVLALLVAFASAKSIVPKNVEGIERCPSAGVVHAVRVPGCTIVPCEVFAGISVTLEADFTPSESGPRMRLFVTTVFLGITITLTDELIEGQVEGGAPYTVRYLIEDIPELYVGFQLPLTIELFSNSGTKECCAKAPVKVSRPPFF